MTNINNFMTQKEQYSHAFLHNDKKLGTSQ
jgi:hypothetical protein